MSGRRKRGYRLPPEVLTRAEALALIEACGDRTWTQIRNKALIVILYRAGLRLGEALALAPKDIDFEACAIRVLQGKGGTNRTVGIDRTALDYVKTWIDLRDEMGFERSGPVFCTRSCTALAQAYVRRMLPELGRKAGIEKRVHAHGLRHTHAAELRAECMDVALIRRQLGHRSLLTTIGYLDHLAPEILTLRVSARPWEASCKRTHSETLPGTPLAEAIN